MRSGICRNLLQVIVYVFCRFVHFLSYTGVFSYTAVYVDDHTAIPLFECGDMIIFSSFAASSVKR